MFVLGKEIPNPMPMSGALYEFSDLDIESEFHKLGESLEAQKEKKALQFDNSFLKGQIITSNADKGLVVRKWKFTPHQEITIRRIGTHHEENKKYLLLYFLSPATLRLIEIRKKIRTNSSRNNIFLGPGISTEFILTPKQLFYVFEISFTLPWLMEQVKDADPLVKHQLLQYISEGSQSVLIEPFTLEEHRTLHQLEVCMCPDHAEDFFIRSRAYALAVSFFSKIVNHREASIVQAGLQYDQIIEAELLIMENIKKPPSIETIARKVNMSVASLIRKFKMIHGKSIHEYYVERKMELARKLILEYKMSIKHLAELLGYNQASAFIETFTKKYGYTPGILKMVRDKFAFF